MPGSPNFGAKEDSYAMEGTRLQILKTLQRTNQATVEALARSLSLAPATIRRHMDILQRDHLISYREVKKPTGRPEYSFFLTEDGHEELPKDYPRLLGLMFQETASLERGDLEGRDGESVLELLLTRMAKRVAESVPAATGAGLAQRAEALALVLEGALFTPQVATEGKSIRIDVFNCPLRSVALAHHSACTFCYQLISSVLGGELSVERCVSRGDSNCCYLAS